MWHVLSVMRAKGLPAPAKLALAAIADDASEHTDLSWPGLEKVQEWSNTQPRQALRIISDLIERGHIERVQSGKRGHRAVYRMITGSQIERVSSATPKERVSSERERVSSEGRKGVIAVTPLSGTSSPELHSPEELKPALTSERARSHSDVLPASEEQITFMRDNFIALHGETPSEAQEEAWSNYTSADANETISEYWSEIEHGGAMLSSDALELADHLSPRARAYHEARAS